jgi:hypothetical protein
MGKDDDDVTEAHDQRMTVHIITHIDQHEPRPGDPHYDLFTKAKARMKRQGLWRCAIGDDYCGGDIELHHTHIEAMHLDYIDLDKVNKGFGLHLENDDDFFQWVESPGNLEPLCVVHHRSHYGVHVLPHPLWEPLRYRKKSAKPSAEVEVIDGLEEDAAVTTTTQVRKTSTKSAAGAATAVDTAVKTTVKTAGRTVDERTETVHRESHRSTGHPRKKKGFFARLFGR